MCRIAGVISSQYDTNVASQHVRRMCELQQHGGPDDQGIYVDAEKSLVFGHRRLSLIDLTPGGHQPMLYNEDQLVISFNGEIYNYPSLKKDLQTIGYSFISNSDTEVILAAYAAWGTDSFKKLAGMFAFALYDKKQAKVYLVRDQTGIKPLYYSEHKEDLHFASEVRAFQAIESLHVSNEFWPVYFMAYGHLPEPITTLKHIKPLPKGCFLEYSLSTRSSQVQSYGYLSYLEKINNKEEAVSQIRQQLQFAVERHLISDAPIGAFLSGGIDSSLIALLAGKVVKDNLTTLSIYFNEQHYSEKPFQELIAQKLNGNHQDFCLSHEDFDHYLPSIIEAMDLPSSDGINTWFISKYAKEKGLKAVLSGLGGDELFGGYPSFNRIKTTSYLQQLPTYTLRASRYSRSKKIRRLVYLSLPGTKGKYLFLRGHFVPSEIARHLKMPEEQVWQLLEEQPTLPLISHLTQKNQASWMEMNLYMQNQLLRDSDVMSMAHGIEIRVPFLDLDFMKLVMKIQSSIKYEESGKKLLTDSFSDILPSSIYNRSKMGFSFPFREWMQQNEWLKDVLQSGSRETQKTYAAFLNGQAHWSQALSLLLIQNSHAERKSAFSYA